MMIRTAVERWINGFPRRRSFDSEADPAEREPDSKSSATRRGRVPPARGTLQAADGRTASPSERYRCHRLPSHKDTTPARGGTVTALARRVNHRYCRARFIISGTL